MRRITMRSYGTLQRVAACAPQLKRNTQYIMNKLFPELDPKERIQALIENKIFPLYKENGFR